MKKPERPGLSRKKPLSGEDELLWSHTASSLTPLKRAKGRVHHAARPSEDSEHPATRLSRVPTELGNHFTHVKAHAPPHREAHPVPPKARPAPDLAEFDPKKARKIRQGRTEIEARIDLHGMRQSEAHAALRRFISASFHRGLRHVLVITGKGSPARRIAQDDYDLTGSHERGVLKRNVPMWLSEPDMRAIVVSFTAAAIQHGGEGALYVHLRNPERVR